MAIEKCQRDFTRIIHGIGFLSYSERLQKLGLTTLLERRMRGDLIEAYKIINGHVNYGHQMFNHNLHIVLVIYAMYHPAGPDLH
jgi:hypothetical protein